MTSFSLHHCLKGHVSLHSHNTDQSFNTWVWGEHAPALARVFLNSHVDAAQPQMTSLPGCAPMQRTAGQDRAMWAQGHGPQGHKLSWPVGTHV